MKRIIIVCEGITEQTFCATTLQKHFQAKGIYIQAPLIKHSKGGIVKWPVLKHQIEMHLKTDVSAVVTTFIDYYGLYSKHDFPGWSEAGKIQDTNSRVDYLVKKMFDDVDKSLRYRFIPYLQLHEFEGLLFTDIKVIYDQIPVYDIVGKEELEQTFRDYDNPEMINDNRETSPSHRLKRIIRGYNKVVYGDILTDAVGLPRIRSKSPRFNRWIADLEKI